MEDIEKEVKELSCECIDYKPRNFDFGEGYLSKWEIGFNLTEEEQENEEFYPLMNHIYPLPPDFKPSDEMKDKLSNTTIVYLINEDRYFLALTGGGMDLSWEICESYVNLGYLPLKHFCELPRMADKQIKGNKKNEKIILACLRSCEVSEIKTKQIIEKLNNILKQDEL